MEKNNEIKYGFVETYAGDMAKVIENDKEGLVKKIIHEEEKHEEENKNLSPESKKNRIFLFVGFIFIIISAIVLSFLILKKDVNHVLIEEEFVPLIYSDQNTSLEISGLKKEEIIQTVFDKINTTKVKVEGIDGFYLKENAKNIGLRRFISLINSSFAPGDNVLFVNDNFLLGVENNKHNKNFFILLKARSTADIFNSLRAWERKMFADLYGFFGITISADTNHLLTKEFQDGLIENKNARILYDKDNQIVLMYIFINDNFTIITNSQNAMHEVMLRLTSSQKKK